MTTRRLLVLVAASVLGLAAACSRDPITPTTTPTPTPTPSPTPVITITAPTLVEPPSGATAYGWPRFTWENAGKTNTTNALIYRFDLSTRDDFSTVAFTTTVNEESGRTSFTPPSTQAPPAEGTLYWRVVAIDQANAVQSQPSATENFKYYENTEQNRLAVQLYGSLWGSARPSGTRGRARLGPGWNPGQRRSFNGALFMSPPIEALRIFDLLDLGYDPQAALNWLKSNGYPTGVPTEGIWYPGTATIGFPYQYMALVRGEWELVHRVGA